jgi:predicted ArsR family transcriptional regulator
MKSDCRKRFVRVVSEAEKASLEVMLKNTKTLCERNRIHGVILSSRGKTVDEISDFLLVSQRTVRRALDRFEKDGLEGLKEKKHLGRPPKIPP